MLTENQLSDLESSERELRDRKMMLDTAVDVQAILRILVDKEIITREEVKRMREEVRESPKYQKAYIYIEQTAAEIQKYKADPAERLREMFRRKTNGK